MDGREGQRGDQGNAGWSREGLTQGADSKEGGGGSTGRQAAGQRERVRRSAAVRTDSEANQQGSEVSGDSSTLWGSR